jgi:hypothetical protein
MREEDLTRTSLHLGSMGHDELETPSGALADRTFAPVLALGSTRKPARDRPSSLIGVASAQRRDRTKSDTPPASTAEASAVGVIEP